MMSGGGLGMLGSLPMLLWWALGIVAIVLAARWLFSGGGSAGPRGDSALAILQERYARGEIGKEELDARKRDLE